MNEKMPEGQISMQDIQKLRELSKASISDCKKALTETKTVEEALEWLKKKGIVDGLRLQGESKEGAITSYIHTNGKVGVLLDVGCQTDFVARTEEFKTFSKNIAMHIAGNDIPPQYVEEKDISNEVLVKQTEFFLGAAKEAKNWRAEDDKDGKKLDLVNKVASGKLAKWKKDICLLNQKYVKDPQLTIGDLVNQLSGITREKIIIRRFTRYA